MNGKCERKFKCMAWKFISAWYSVYFSVRNTSHTGGTEMAAEVKIIIPSNWTEQFSYICGSDLQ